MPAAVMPAPGNIMSKTKLNVQDSQQIYVDKMSTMRHKPASLGPAASQISTKRGPAELYHQIEKKNKIEYSKKLQCISILKMLMNHPSGWIFNQPVDPVSLKIPDYFSVIKKPMDLGTVKTKLDKDIYAEMEEFAADVRLTFRNAKIYNPPDNEVHVMAIKLNDIFNSRWISSEQNQSKIISKVEQPNVLQRESTKAETFSSCKTLQSKAGQHLLSEERMQKSQNMNHDFKKRPLPTSSGQISMYATKKQKLTISSKPDSTGNSSASCPRVSLSDINPSSSSRVRDPSSCQAGLLSQKPASNESYSSSQRFKCTKDSHESRGISEQITISNSCSSSQKSKSDPDSNGAISTLEEEHGRPISSISTAVACREMPEISLYDGALSPDKALRVAALKFRFADTIVKRQKTFLNNGANVDPEVIQREKLKLEKEQCQERLRAEAQIRANQAASRIKREAEVKLIRAREREAARLALQKIEKTVEFEDNLAILKELENVAGIPFSIYIFSPLGGTQSVFGGSHQCPLQRLGLILRDECFDEEDNFVAKVSYNEDIEEGEICL